MGLFYFSDGTPLIENVRLKSKNGPKNVPKIILDIPGKQTHTSDTIIAHTG